MAGFGLKLLSTTASEKSISLSGLAASAASSLRIDSGTLFIYFPFQFGGTVVLLASGCARRFALTLYYEWIDLR